MKKRTRVTAVVLTAAMAVSVMAGCGNNQEVVETNNQEAEYPYTGAAPITDTEGASVSILAQNSWYSTVDFAQTPIIQKVAEKAGVTIDWNLVSPTNYVNSISPMLAAGTDLPDIVELPDLDPNMTYIQSGLFVPLDEYIDQYMPNYKKYLEENPDVKASLTAEDGHIYYVPQTVVTDNYQPCMMINMQWLNELGMEVPKTLDEFVAVLKAFRDNDMNGNGDTTDEVPLSIMAKDISYMFGPAFGLSFGIDNASGFYADENGNVHYAYAEDAYKDYVTFLHELYEEGLLEVEFTSLTRDQITERCAQNKAGVVFDFSWQMSQLYSAQYPQYDGTEGVMVGIPPLSSEKEGYYLARTPISNIFGVSAKSDHVLLAVKFLDYAMSEECQEMYVWGIEGESYTKHPDGTKAYTEAASDSMWLQGLGINPGCLPSRQSVEATDVLLPEWHAAVDKELASYMQDPWPFIYATADESNIISQYLTDMKTYVEEMNVAFITGTTSLDTFDSFQSTLKSMNLEQLLEIKQNQYDRFLANVK